ncbi:hypothetical protein F4782DRAFT_196464 [Xylaria castorea]|nr:hypothetical protein F4782DRAFT_196464 [Xylaria castorea]
MICIDVYFFYAISLFGACRKLCRSMPAGLAQAVHLSVILCAFTLVDPAIKAGVSPRFSPLGLSFLFFLFCQTSLRINYYFLRPRLFRIPQSV